MFKSVPSFLVCLREVGTQCHLICGTTVGFTEYFCHLKVEIKKPKTIMDHNILIQIYYSISAQWKSRPCLHILGYTQSLIINPVYFPVRILLLITYTLYHVEPTALWQIILICYKNTLNYKRSLFIGKYTKLV